MKGAVAFEYKCKITGVTGRVLFALGYGVVCDAFTTNGITDNLAKAMYPRIKRGDFEVIPVLVDPDESSQDNWRNSIIDAYRKFAEEHKARFTA